MSFQDREITLTFTLGTGNFGTTGKNTVTVSGLRVSCAIDVAGGAAQIECLLRVYGLTLDKMLELGVQQRVPGLARRNTVSVVANGALVFEGDINEAWPDFGGSPETCYHVAATSGYFVAVADALPSSYQGPADVAGIMAALAELMGYGFQNMGVKGITLSNPYFQGTLWDQARECARDANIRWRVDCGILRIWPNPTPVTDNTILINKDTGLIRYPTVDAFGPLFSCLFNPEIRYGTFVKLESIIKPAAGVWFIYTLSHRLESQVIRGEWVSHLKGSNPLYVVPQ